MKKSFARTLVALAIAAVLCSAAWADDKSKSEPGASGAQATVSGKQTQNGNAVNNEIVIFLNRLSDVLWLMARWEETNASESVLNLT